MRAAWAEEKIVIQALAETSPQPEPLKAGASAGEHGYLWDFADSLSWDPCYDVEEDDGPSQLDACGADFYVHERAYHGHVGS